MRGSVDLVGRPWGSLDGGLLRRLRKSGAVAALAGCLLGGLQEETTAQVIPETRGRPSLRATRLLLRTVRR